VLKRSFCALSIFVIGGTADAWRRRDVPAVFAPASVNFIDPTSRSFFANGQTRRWTPEFLRLFELMATGQIDRVATYGQAKATPGAATENFPRCGRHRRWWGATSRRRTTRPARERSLIGYALWRRDFGGKADIVNTNRAHQRQDRHDHRGDAKGFCVSKRTRSCGFRSSASSAVPRNAPTSRRRPCWPS
jgi:hypothetical protein